jgi:acetyl-CoA C-acetyltransferase
MGEAVIVAAVRTAIADWHRGGGARSELSIHQIAGAPVAEALKRPGVAPDDVDDLVLGEVLLA